MNLYHLEHTALENVPGKPVRCGICHTSRPRSPDPCSSCGAPHRYRLPRAGLAFLALGILLLLGSC